jgi:hypothetical protein
MDVDMPGHRYTGVMLDAEQENKQLGKYMFENSNPTKMNIGDVKMNRRSALACLGAIFGTSAYHERIFARQDGQPATSLTGLYGKNYPKFLHAPEKWAEPNMATWATFAKERTPAPYKD